MPDRSAEGAPAEPDSTLPRITVITPSYNQGEFIEATIKSVLEQGYPDLEYLVIDGGSTDDTVRILAAYGDRLRWSSEPDRGQAHALNKGLRMATGSVVGYLNSDDVYAAGTLLRVGRAFREDPELHWLTGRCRTIDSGGGEIRRPITAWKNLWLAIGSRRALKVLDFISQPATFWSRHAVLTVGEFDESLRYAMDYDYSLRMARHFRFRVLPHYLASFRVHPRSKAGSSARAQFDVDLAIARRYTRSRVLLGLHRLHNSIAVAIYRILLGSGS